MLKGIKNSIKGYLALLGERPPRKLSKRKLRKLRKKEAKQSKITLKTRGKQLEDTAPAGQALPAREIIEKPAPKLPLCLNCGEPLRGKFCFNCGQKDSDYRRPYWTFLEDFSDNIFSRDSRLWRTLGYLLFMPGAMTRDYIAGKRIRYLPPIRLFLITIIMFFLTVSVLNVAIVKFTGEAITYQDRLATLAGRLDNEEADIERYTEEERQGKVASATDDRDDVLEDIADLNSWREQQLANPDQEEVRRTPQGELIYDYNVQPEMFAMISKQDMALPEDVIADTFQFDTGAGDDTQGFVVTIPDDENGADEDIPEFLEDLGGDVERGLQNAARDPRRLNNALNNWVPLIMAIFIPLFAIFLRFFYWKREHYIYNHLVFSLHFHTYLFFILTFFVVAQVYLGSSVSTWMFFGAVPLYLFIALKVASGNGWFRTFFKFLVISLFYIIGFSLMLGAVFIFAFAEA